MQRSLPVWSRALLFGFVVAIGAPALQAQSQEQQWTTVMYRKSEPGKAAAHRQFIETTWKKLAQAMIDEGTNRGAVAMRLTQPYASNANFDYAYVSFAAKRPSVAPTPQATLEARAKKAGFESWQKFLDAANAVSKTVKSEWLTSSLRMGAAQQGNYMRVMRYQIDYEDVATVNRFMREFLNPLNAARVKDGTLQGYSVHSPAMMTVEEAGFAQSVSFLVKDADAAMSGPRRLNEESFKKVFPDKSYVNFVTERAAISKLRKPVATRLYEVVAVVGAMPPAGASPTGGE